MKSILVSTCLFLLVRPVAGQTFTDVSSLIDSVATVFSVGASIVDVNSDGLKDIYRFQGLYLQRPDGTFEESTGETGLNNPDGTSAEGSTVFGGIFSDYDNDGYLDIFFEDLAEFSRMFRGRGDGSFYHANDEAGVQIGSVLQGSVWADFDNDGFVDLFAGGDGAPSALYMNDGDGTFTNASANVAYSPLRNVYGVAAADFDNDGDIDIYIASCSSDPVASTNLLFENDGSGNFTEIAASLGLNDDRGGWGVVWLDVNNDGWLDLFVANMTISGAGIETRPGYNRLYLSNGMGEYFDQASPMGIEGHMDDFTIGATAGDFNNDGFTDIAVANSRGPNQGVQIYINNGGSNFTHLGEVNTASNNTQVVASGDVDGDGWLDLFSSGFQGDYLFYNDQGNNNYLTVSLVGTSSNRSGIGARVRAAAPGLSQIREITAGNGMTSQSDGLEAHFGLGAQESVDSLVIHWPSGQIDIITGVETNQAVHIVEGIGLQNAPTGFATIDPAPNEFADAPDSVDFKWEQSMDADGDPLAYTLKLLDLETNDLLTFETADTSLSVDRQILTENGAYRWTVDVSDGYSIRRSWDRQRFRLAQPVSVAPPEIPVPTLTVSAYPNPFREGATFDIQVETPMVVTLEVMDVTGRLVARTESSQMSGRGVMFWDGRSRSGELVGPGVYLFRVSGDRTMATGKLVKL